MCMKAQHNLVLLYFFVCCFIYFFIHYERENYEDLLINITGSDKIYRVFY